MVEKHKHKKSVALKFCVALNDFERRKLRSKSLDISCYMMLTFVYCLTLIKSLLYILKTHVFFFIKKLLLL